MITQEDIERLRRFMELRRAKDEAEVALKNAKSDLREAEADLYETLAANPLTGALKVDLGGEWGVVSFGPRETYYGRVIDEEAALEYYEQRAMVEEVSAPKFVMARINEEVRSCMEEGRNPPPGIDYYARRGITVTRQKT